MPGVRVGHHQRTGRGWQTGTTAIIVPGGAVAGVDVRGGGPGTRETDALDPRNLVDRIHAVCLTGGSAYGLAAADGVVEYLEARHLGVQVGPAPHEIVPVVPAAVIFDLGRGGQFGRRPDRSFGERAAKSARTVAGRGAIGAGTGARAGGLQAGIGMASATIEIGETTFVVAAIAVVNASGSLIDMSTGLPWSSSPSVRRALRRPNAEQRAAVRTIFETAHAPALNTTIGIVATDAALARPEAGRLAQSAHDGLSRAIRPAHGLMDGDTVFGLATGTHQLGSGDAGIVRGVESRASQLNRLLAAAADVFETACIDAVLTAASSGSAMSYRDVCPSAFRA